MFESALNLSKKIVFLRSTILFMALKNAKTRYAGTIGGIFWALLNPLATVLVYWLVFGVGFRVQPSGNLPFIAVFLAGFIPWMLFAEVLSANIQAVTGNPHLVKKTVFPTEILPLSNILTAIIPHAFLILVLAVIMRWNGLPLTFKAFGFFYYLTGLCVFSLGLGWVVAALNVFYRDIGQSLLVFLNIWFWLTPIAWFSHILPAKWNFLIQLNPLVWVVEGYRSSFLVGYMPALNWNSHIYFWAISLSMLLCGASIFKKLKFEFPDAL